MGVIKINKLVGAGIEDTYEALEAVTERFIKSSELGISPRVLNYYKTHGLLFPETRVEKHVHPIFNFTDYVWFQMIHEMRRYDIGLSVIRNVQDLFLTPWPIEEFMQELKYAEKFIAKLPENIRDEFLDVLHSDIDWKEVEKQFNFNLLSLVLAEAIVKRKHMAMMVNCDGDICPFSFEDLNELNEDGVLQKFLQKTYLSISLSEIIKKFIINFSLELSIYKLSLLSKREAELIKLLHEHKIESLTVHKDRSNTIELIEVKETYNNLDKESRLLDLILKDGYQTIEFKTQDGKIVHCKNIRKIKPL